MRSAQEFILLPSELESLVMVLPLSRHCSYHTKVWKRNLQLNAYVGYWKPPDLV